jgi:hypothetical protein
MVIYLILTDPNRMAERTQQISAGPDAPGRIFNLDKQISLISSQNIFKTIF